MATGYWTDERMQTLVTLWEAGQSAAVIAKALGGVSRSAVIGKAHRLRLGKRVTVKDLRNRQSLRTTRAHTARKAKLPPRSHWPVVPVVSRPDVGGPVSRNKTLLDLEPHECRWPYGDEIPYVFCGHGVAPGLSYCPHHARIAAEPLKSREERVREFRVVSGAPELPNAPREAENQFEEVS